MTTKNNCKGKGGELGFLRSHTSGGGAAVCMGPSGIWGWGRRAVRFANAHLNRDEAAVKMGHPDFLHSHTSRGEALRYVWGTRHPGIWGWGRRAVRFANAHLNHDEAAVKMGHPDFLHSHTSRGGAAVCMGHPDFLYFTHWGWLGWGACPVDWVGYVYDEEHFWWWGTYSYFDYSWRRVGYARRCDCGA